MSDTVELIIVGTMLLIVIGAVLYFLWASPARKARRALAKPAVPIDSARVGGAIRIDGRVEGPASRHTLEGRPCVYAHIALLHFFRRTGSDGAVSESWRERVVEERGEEVRLSDGSGSAVLIPAGATWVDWASWADVDWSRLSAGEEALVEKGGDDVRRDAPAKIRQHLLTEGDAIAIHGTVAERRADGTVVVAAPAGGMLAIGPAAPPES